MPDRFTHIAVADRDVSLWFCTDGAAWMFADPDRVRPGEAMRLAEWGRDTEKPHPFGWRAADVVERAVIARELARVARVDERAARLFAGLSAAAVSTEASGSLR